MHNETPAPLPPQAASALVTSGRMAGALGLVLWASCPLTWFLTAEVGPLVLGKISVGLACVVFYLLTNRGFFARVAGSRSTGRLILSAITVVAVAALLGGINYAAHTHPWERDFTQEGLYTLSPQTRSVVTGLKADVTVYGFYASYEQAYPMVEDSLARLARLGNHLHYSMVDPQSRPDLVERYQVTDRGPRIVVCTATHDARAKDISEQELVNAIVQVSEQTRKKVYLLTGHGELDTADATAPEGGQAFAAAIGAEGYETAHLDLRQTSAAAAAKRAVVDDGGADGAGPGLHVPDDAAVVVALGPAHPLLEPEVAALDRYLTHGGRLMVFTEPRLKTGLEGLLAQWRIRAEDDLIVDTNPLNRLLGLGAAAPMVQPVKGDHPIVQGLSAAMVLSTARSLSLASGGIAGVEVTPLAHTAETAWGETHVGKDGTAEKDARDHLPPLFVAAASERHIPAGDTGESEGSPPRSATARLVAFGDADFVTNKYLGMQGNRDFVLNSLNWLAEQEGKITIRPKSRAASQLYLSGTQMNQVKFLSMDILPVLIVAIGLGITLVRRQR